MAKYEPLETYFKKIAPPTREITLSYDQINGIIESSLPNSANKYSAWWSNEISGSHVQAHAWLNAGWKVDSVDFDRKRVRFLRN